ncbi:hypothetical protein D918_03314 [Trichuris suis]|nr:hypothetical protein D918_03314 [Trichuris suis]
MPIKRHENGQMWKSDLSRVVNEPIQSTPDITVNLKSGRFTSCHATVMQSS